MRFWRSRLLRQLESKRKRLHLVKEYLKVYKYNNSYN